MTLAAGIFLYAAWEPLLTDLRPIPECARRGEACMQTSALRVVGITVSHLLGSSGRGVVYNQGSLVCRTVKQIGEHTPCFGCGET